MQIPLCLIPPWTGILIIGVGEVIDLLQEILDNGKPKSQVQEVIMPIASAEQGLKYHYLMQ